MKKRLTYIILLIVIIAVEVVIALTQHDNFLRYYGGDIIVVWAVYCLVQSFICHEKRYAVHIGVFIFAVIVEFLQAIKIVELIGLGDIAFFRTLIGTSFSVVDIICYGVGTAIGCVGTFAYERKKIRRNAIDIT